MFNKCIKIISGSVALCAASLAVAASDFQASFAPDNDLWMQDKFESASTMTPELFNHIIAIAKEFYDPMAAANNETLNIKANWDNPTVNANCMRNNGMVTVNMYGGLARRDEVTPEGFALVLCHELGHAYGGAPFLQASRHIAAEGQADYYGAQDCLEKVLQKLEEYPEQLLKTPYTEKSCTDAYSADAPRLARCMRQLSAGQSLGDLLSVMMKETKPNYETPDTTVVAETTLSYPDTLQCRIDTYFNGSLGLARPKCWFNR